jgi:hypothetical protein
LRHLRKKETREPSTKDPPSTAKEAAHQIVAAAEAHTHFDLHTACSTIVRQTIAQKIAPFSSSTEEKWSKISNSLHTNQCQEKSTILCNGLPPPAILSILPLAFSTRLPKQPSPSSDLLSVISLRHNQPPTTSDSSQITFSPLAPQITYPLAVPQITYPVPNNTNPQVKTEAYPPPPPPPQIKEPP